jgi:hypothetical protein
MSSLPLPTQTPATKKDIMIKWFQQLSIMTKIGTILTAVLLLASFLIWSYAVIHPLTTTANMCPEPSLVVPFIQCQETLSPEATWLTAQVFAVALPFMFLTYFTHKIPKMRLNPAITAALVPFILAGTAMLGVVTFYAFIIIFLLVGAFAAPWPLLIIFPLLVFANEIITNYRYGQRKSIHTSTSIAQQFTEVTPNDENGKQL